MEDRKHKKKQSKIKAPITEVKNTLQGINCKLNEAENQENGTVSQCRKKNADCGSQKT